MVIFLLGEDRAYLSWLAHHRNGFVLDWLRQPTKKKPVIHRANCPEIKSAKTRQTHWTTGRHIKVCSLALDELASWASDEAGGEADYCDQCKPGDPESSAAASGDRHLTKLGKEIVDSVVEAAVIHLDRPDSAYEMTVGDLAASLGKTAGQISPALRRLAEDGYLRVSDAAESDAPLPGNGRIFPTADALRLLPAFQHMAQPQVQAELDSLSEQD